MADVIRLNLRVPAAKMEAIREATKPLGFINDASAVNYLLTVALQTAQASAAAVRGVEGQKIMFDFLRTVTQADAEKEKVVE